MFKNIQDKLLISNPLLWNLKIVPFACIALVFHLIFFAVGYSNGEVVFTDNYYDHYDGGVDTAVVIFFSVVVSILITIVWLVLYSRNNAFKSFYPKTNFSLFKEFLYILLFTSMTSTFTLTYLYATDFRTRNYFPEEEVAKKLEIMSLATPFLEGSFIESNYVSVLVDGQYKNETRETFTYRGRTYSLNSLMNKTVENDNSYYTTYNDSVLNTRVKNWMYNNQKDSVKWVFTEFMKIAKEHNLKSNITADKWFSLVYNYPEFEDYTVIRRSDSQQPYNDYSIPVVDSAGVAVAAVDSARQALSPFYVPYESLKSGYQEISKAHDNPAIDLESIYFYFYFAIGLAIAIFSFKVTSGRNWLIALVSLGILSLIVGIFSAISAGTMFFIFYWMLFLGLLIHFFATVASRSGKGISGITLNQILWLVPSFVPILYYCILDIAKDSSNYYNSSGKYVNGQFISESYPKIEWMEDHFPEMMIGNIAIIILFIFLFSVQIKKWKGIAED